jgi:hypothetical protein
MKYIYSSLSCMILFMSVAVAQDWSGVVERFGPAAAKIEVMENLLVYSSGSGFVIDKSGRILTNAHVVKDAEHVSSRTIRVSLPRSAKPDEFLVATIDLISDDLDLAVLTVPGPLPSSVTMAPGKIPPLMSEVLVVGFPLGKNFKATPGFIQAMQDIPEMGQMLDLSAAVDPGNSGGPVFGKDGTVIGIVTAKIEGANFNLALPIGNVIDFMDLIKNPVSVAISSTPNGSRVFTNGTYRGVTPLDLRLLSRKIEVTVEAEGFTPLKRTISTEDLTSAAKVFELKEVVSTTSKVHLQTTPPGARIWINNSEIGKTPLDIDLDKGSKLRIRSKLSGYKDLNTEALVTNDKEQTIQLDLVKSGWF